MLLASTLLSWHNALFLHAINQCDSPGPGPVLPILKSINAPLILPGVLLGAIDALLLRNYSLPYYWSQGILISAVGVLWYSVAKNLQAWRTRRAVLMLSWRPARFLLDMFLVVIGLYSFLGAAASARERITLRSLRGQGCYGPNSIFMLSTSASACVFLGWASVLVFVYGRDFIHCIRSRAGTIHLAE